jgi:UDP-N-acetylmuramoyl-tripeptide--D-alanyl-D-alanine ligase
MACEFTIQQIVEATGGQILSEVATSFKGVGTDTRTDLSQNIFIALKGDNFDAHHFLAEAVAKGAQCLLIHEDAKGLPELLPKVSVVKVRNTLTGLQDLARSWRRRISASLVGITGSNGKTSTKEFAATILAEQFKVFANKKSFNNHWGVPMTILAIPMDTEVALVEMGMNHAEELTKLSKIARPDIVLCTNVGRAHLGNFKDGINGVADAKEEIYLANPNAVQIFNYDNEYTNKMFQRVHKLLGTERVRVFSSFSAGAEVSFRATHMHLDSITIVGHIKGIKGEARVEVFGRHNVANLMAACSIGVALKIEPEVLWEAIKKCKTNWGRNQLHKLPNGTSVLFDGYNSNPDSAAMLIKNIFEIQCEGQKLAVMGEMLELGTQAGPAHSELGEMISNTDINTVWFYGPSHKDFEAGFRRGTLKKL